MNLGLPVEGERFRLDASADGIDVVRRADGQTVGTIALESTGDEFIVRSLCIDPGARSYGAGSEAALLLNQAFDAAGARRVRAPAAPDLGLSVYFWIRMGYRPLHGEGPDGGIWFERKR